MFNPIKAVRNLISRRIRKEDDQGFSCDVYDLKKGEMIFGTHDVDEFLQYLKELIDESDDTGIEEEEEDRCCDCGCCCDMDCEECECASDGPNAFCELEIPVSVNVVGTPVKAKLKLTLTEAAEE